MAISKTDRDAYFDWVTDVTTMKCPVGVAAEPLDRAKMKPGAKWHEFRLFLIYAFSTYGTYGRNMYAGQVTLAGDFGKSRPTLSQWLTLADELGVIRKVAEATTIRGTTYEISDAWKIRLAERVSVSNYSNFPEPAWQDSRAA